MAADELLTGLFDGEVGPLMVITAPRVPSGGTGSGRK